MTLSSALRIASRSGAIGLRVADCRRATSPASAAAEGPVSPPTVDVHHHLDHAAAVAGRPDDVAVLRHVAVLAVRRSAFEERCEESGRVVASGSLPRPCPRAWRTSTPSSACAAERPHPPASADRTSVRRQIRRRADGAPWFAWSRARRAAARASRCRASPARSRSGRRGNVLAGDVERSGSKLPSRSCRTRFRSGSAGNVTESVFGALFERRNGLFATRSRGGRSPDVRPRKSAA